MVFKSSRLMVASLLVMGVAACAADGQNMDTKTVKKAPVRMDAPAPKGLSIAAYDDDINNVLASLNGMSRTLDRMEGDLQTLTLKRIAAMREEIENTNRQLEAIQQSLADAGVAKPPVKISAPQEVRGDMAKPEVVAPKPVVESKPKAPKKVETKKTEPVAKAANNTVQAARVGVHEDKVRVVLDIAGAPVKHVSHFDEVEKLLTVELPKLAWSAAHELSFGDKNPSLNRYAAQKSDAGSMVVFSLKDGVKASEPKWIAGSGNTPSRLIIDFTR